tara:strand:- start:242 stop:3232 length:2991 start_codon:yes stop_codon:yes gene_type:complete
MATNDIIDLDQLLEDYESGSLAINQDAKSAREIEIQNLSKYGYRDFAGNLGLSNPRVQFDQIDPTAQGNLQEAIRKGILADDPYFIENYLNTAPPEVRAEYSGVDVTGGAKGDVIRQLELLPNDVRGNLDSVTKILQKNYSNDYDIPRTYDYNVRVEPNTNRLIFNDPQNDNKPTLINPPGINSGDFFAFAEPLAVEISAALAGGYGGVFTAPLTGGVLNPVSVGIASEVLATYLWRLQNLDYLDEEGYLPEGYNKNVQAMKDAGFTALAGIGGTAAFKLAKVAFGVRNPGKNFPLDEDEFIESFDAVKKEGGEINDLTSPQVVIAAAAEDPNKIIKSPAEEVEESLRKVAEGDSPSGAALREKYAKQELEGRQKIEGEFEGAGTNRETADYESGSFEKQTQGREFQAVAYEGIGLDPLLKQADDEIIKFSDETDTLFRDLTEGKLDFNTAGRQIREGSMKVKDAAYKKVDAKFEESAKIANLNRGKPFDLSSMTSFLKTFDRRLLDQALPDRDQRKIVTNLLKKISDNPKQSKKAYDSDLSSIRSLITDAANKGRDLGPLISVRDELLKVRKNALGKNTEGSKVFKEAELEYRQFNDDFNNDLTSRFFSLQEASTNLFKKGDKQAYDSVLNFLRGNITKSTDGTLSSPEFIDKILLDPINESGLQGLKKGVINDFYNKVLKEQGGQISPKGEEALNNWLKQNGDIVKKFFDEDELLQFNNAENFIRKFKARELSLKEAQQKAARDPDLQNLGIVVDLTNPEDVFTTTWKAGKITPTRALFNAVSEVGDEGLKDSYKAYIYKDFIDKTTSSGTFGRDAFSGKAIAKYVDEYGDAMSLWFGEEFVENLGNISKKLSPFDNRSGKALTKEDNAVLQATNSLARAYVGLFTTPGRVLTAAKTIGGAELGRKKLQYLREPELLYKAMIENRWQKNPVVRGLVRFLGRIYGDTSGTFDADLQSDVTKEETTLFGPGFQEQLNRGGHVQKKLGMPLKYRFGA